jgi:hypothetical protein
MVLRLSEDVQAEDAFEERRVPEGDGALVFVGDFEPDRDPSTFGSAARRVKLNVLRSSLGRIS